MFKLESRLKSLYPCLSLPHCLSLSFSSVPVPFYCKEKIKEALCFSQRIETRASSEQSLFIYKKNTLLLHCAHNNYILVLPNFLATSPPFSVNSKNSIWVLLKTTIMEVSSSPISIQTTPLQDHPEASPKPYKKSFVTTLKEAATLRSHSFKEDTYFISNLRSSEKKALQELKDKLVASEASDSSMWGVPLLGGDDKADVILLKFLRARDFRVSDSLNMLLKCLAWRKEFGADNVVEEELGFKELEGVVAYMHGYDREGHPVCYNAYGVFKDKEMYERIFGDDEKLQKFLRWRVQVLERGINLLHFKPGGVNSIIQVTDLKDMPKRELRVASNHILSLFQDNYPEMVARKIFINVPWYFSVLYSMFSPFLTQRTKSKFVISKEGNVAETLYKFIRPEDVPIQYGGLSRPSDLQNGPPKPASEFTVKGGEKVNIQIEGIEAGATITWDIVVGGWELEYSAEFVPSAEGSYTIAVEKPRKVAASEEAIHNSFTPHEPGKMVLSVDNTTSRRKKVAAYRYIVRKSTALVPATFNYAN